MMYKKIIVPLDGSRLAEQILPYARQLAQAFGIPVELFCVQDPDQIIPYLQQRQIGEYLKVVSDRYLSSLHPTPSVESGSPAEVIVDRAAEDSGNLIAMATHGLSAVHRWLLGSVASKVVHSAKNPLLLVRGDEAGDPAREVRIKTLLVPLDGSALAEKVLVQAKALARRLDLEMVLARVYALPPESFLVGDGLSIDAVTRVREGVRQQAEEYLKGVTERMQAEGVTSVSPVALQGDAAQEIIELGRRIPDCLIAMSTHGRSGVGRWVLGSVAEKVIHHSKDPVLIVRPHS